MVSIRYQSLIALVTFELFFCVGCPEIVSRKQWNAVIVHNTKLPVYPAPFVIVHHTAENTCDNREVCAREIYAIQQFHRKKKGWDDIGYNFLISSAGNVYEGRGWAKQGAHAKIYNNKSVGIAFIGTHIKQLPSSAAINSFHNLVRCGVKLGHISSSYLLIGHRQTAQTQCPGQKLFQEIQKWPHYKPGMN